MAENVVIKGHIKFDIPLKSYYGSSVIALI